MDFEESLGALIIAHLALTKTMMAIVEDAIEDDGDGDDELDPSDLPDGISIKVSRSPKHEPEISQSRLEKVELEDLPESVQAIIKKIVKGIHSAPEAA